MTTTIAHLDRILTENPIGMTAAAQMMGTYRGGRPCHPSTITRWCLHGVKLPNGQRLKLEHIRVVDRIMTSKDALLRFLAAQQTPADVPDAPTPRSPARRKAATRRATSELDQMGI